MPRNPPPLAQPAITITHSYDQQEGVPIIFGGVSQLPKTVDWPRDSEGRPMHFFAQVDLSLLPRSLEQAGQNFKMPAFPRAGTLFFFLPLEGDMIFQEGARAIFSADGVTGLSERMPPDQIPLIDGEYYVDMDHVMPCATM